ncbi:MAG: Hpt domain-containing protein [Clostridia bacterium]|nr:Hpt domain-containing protein [Clostridia bacterium]
MTIQECYIELGGNYDEVCTRLPSQSLVERFTLRFLDDKSFDELCTEIEAGHRAEAFRAAHTLKGVCANLAFTKLFNSASELTELLRPETDTVPAEAAALLENVRADYELTTATIRKYHGK